MCSYYLYGQFFLCFNCHPLGLFSEMDSLYELMQVVQDSRPDTKDFDFVSQLKSVMRGCQDLIKTASENTVTPAHWRGILRFICFLNLHFKQVKDESVVKCMFITICFLRMLLMGTVTDTQKLEECKRLLTGLPIPKRLIAFEADTLQFFEHQSFDEVYEIVHSQENEWYQGCFSDWQKVAFAVCFDTTDDDLNQPAESKKQIDTVKLTFFAFYYRECVLKCLLLDAIDGLRVRPADVLVSAADAGDEPKRAYEWLSRSVKNCSDDVYSMGRDAVAFAHTTPDVTRRGDSRLSWQSNLNTWNSERANKHQADILNGINYAKNPSPEDALERFYLDCILLFYFDYVFKQSFELNFIKLFFVHDKDCAVALFRLHQYQHDKIVSPPPLVVLTGGTWNIVQRDKDAGSAMTVTSYGKLCDALWHLLKFLEVQKGGNVFLNKNTLRLQKEIFSVQQEATDPRLFADLTRI